MLLFVNACMREDSRTERLARRWLAECEHDSEVVELDVSALDVRPLDAGTIGLYNQSVATATYDDALFDVAKQFAAADEILIAAPIWNFSVPAKLHDYLELVCSQGVSFDIDETGAYLSLCHARHLTYVETAGGALPQGADDHAFGYVRTLNDWFWKIPEIQLVGAGGLDIVGADVDALLEEALA